MNTNYSQYYRGTTTLPISSGGTVEDKQLVKYELDAKEGHGHHGHKPGHKLTREETVAAMKAIRSQYGDDVMIEFSGRGMAALAKGEKKVDPDSIVKPDEVKLVPFQEAITPLENSHAVKTTEDTPGRMDVLKEKAPDLYNEIQELNQSIVNHKSGEKYGHKFLELHMRAEKVLSGVTEEKTKVAKTSQPKKTTVQGSGIEELLAKIDQINWSRIGKEE